MSEPAAEPAQGSPLPEGLLERLERLETADAARETAYRYAKAIDTPDFELLAGVFAPDATLTTRRGSRRSREAIVDYYREALAAPLARRHFIVNEQVTWLAPGEALMRSSFLYTFAGDDTSILGWGGYVDRIHVLDGVGVIVEKTITVDAHADSRTGWAH
jgi:uncharacterized protein (TIGR02246 family)